MLSTEDLKLSSKKRGYYKKSGNTKELLKREFRYHGFNEDIVEVYYWHLHFPYYVYKGYTYLKLEDVHYFSENSNFGNSLRQIKGGTIRAFQENLQQLIQLIKVHLMPLLKEIKQAEYYKNWFEKITKYDDLIDEELKKNGENDKNKLKLEKWRKERNEAINTLKDKWVSEVDNNKLWLIQKSKTEQGLDYVEAPYLFFGINLDDPFQKRSSLKEQLDADVYPVNITYQAKSVVAKFLYRFYTWLPTAIKETFVTYKLKLSMLKQIYLQIQMYINIMKPLLLEITKKTESFEKGNYFHDFEMENPEVVKLFDYSYSFMSYISMRGFERAGLKIKDLEFTKHGLFIPEGQILTDTKASGFITEEIKDKDGNFTKKYKFYKTDKKDISDEEFKKIKPFELDKRALKIFPTILYEFSQKRRIQSIKTPQGLQPQPYTINQLIYKGYFWNIFEIAAFREKLKVDNLLLLESFIEEISLIKDDLIYYLDQLENEGNKDDESNEEDKKEDEKKREKIFVNPFTSIKEIFPILDLVKKPNFKSSKKDLGLNNINSKIERERLIAKLQTAEDLWKGYMIYRKSHGFLTY